MLGYVTTLSSTTPFNIRIRHTCVNVSYTFIRRSHLSSMVQNDKSDNWEKTLTSIITSERLFEDYGPVKLSLTLQACTRSKYFRLKDNWPIIDKAFTKVAGLLTPTNLDKFNTQDLVLTLKAIERYIKERSYRWSSKGRGMSDASIDLLQDDVIEGCINILDNLRRKITIRTPLREMGMTLSSIVAIDVLRKSDEANKLIPHILNCITQGHQKGTLSISSAKIGDEAFGQGIANVSMALAKLRYEDSSFMDTLASIISGTVNSFTLIDIGQIAFAFGKLHIAASSSDEVSTMFAYIAERVAIEEESLCDNIPTACSLLYSMHKLGLECPEFSNLISSKLLPHVNLLDPNKLLLILPACRNLSNTTEASPGGSNNSDTLYRSAGKALAEKAASLSMGLLIQASTCIHPNDLENISQQLRHRGNATWIYHARYCVSILEALVNNLYTASLDDDGKLAIPGPETCELVREICHYLGNDDRLYGQLDTDQRKILLQLPKLPYFTHLNSLQNVLSSA